MDKKIIDIIMPTGISGKLRLSIVPRWSIISMSRTQNVAEHSYSVAQITRELCRAVGMSARARGHMVELALDHDTGEVVTGDLPNIESSPKYTDYPIIKIADCLEAMIFVGRYCNDNAHVRQWVLDTLGKRIIYYLTLCGDRYGNKVMEITKVITQIRQSI